MTTHFHLEVGLVLGALYLFWGEIGTLRRNQYLSVENVATAPTHSVKSSPGRMALTRIFGPCVAARHLTRCSPTSYISAEPIEYLYFEGI